MYCRFLLFAVSNRILYFGFFVTSGGQTVTSNLAKSCESNKRATFYLQADTSAAELSGTGASIRT